MERLKDLAYIIFVLSLIPGDTFYGDLGIAQSYFLIPLVLLYILKPTIKFKKESFTYISFFIIGVSTFYLLIDIGGAFIEWYRIIGNIFIFITLPYMYKNRSKGFIIIPIIIIGTIPALAFYFGLWEIRYEGLLRLSFLKHDPNIVCYNMLFGFIFTLYYFKFQNYKWLTKYVLIFATSIFYLIPIIATVSRTGIIAFLLILIIYIFYAEQKKYFRLLTLGLTFIIFNLFTINMTNIQNFENLTKRINIDNNDRTVFLQSSLDIIKNNFFFGVGLSKFGNEQWRIKNNFYRYSYGIPIKTSSHNGMLDMMMIGGIFYFLSFLYILFYPWYKIQKSRRLFLSLSPDKFYLDRFLAITVSLTFVVINLTYSSYMSKIAWLAVTILYVFPSWKKPNKVKRNILN